jgi:signal transduction histidine kinase/CheY-like chemotaxis protein
MSQRKLEILILFFTAALIVSVVAIGMTTFQNLKKIERQSEKIYQPNQIILNLKLLVSELRNSENNVRAYNLYRNEAQLDAYENSIELTDQYFDSLYHYHRANDVDRRLLDSVNSLVGRKFMLLNEMLNVRNDAKVLDELNNINRKIDAVIVPDTASIKSAAEKKKKKGFFSRLFGKKEKPEAPLYDSAVLLNRQKISEMKRVVSSVKKKQASQLEESNEKELALVTQDRFIMSRLQDIVREMENAQNEKLKRIEEENIHETTHTNSLIGVFGGMILFILLLLAAFSLYYFYTGRLYRQRLRAAADEAKRLADTREHFLSNMSHEMRTPLNSIMGFTEQLLKTEVVPEQKEQLEIINSCSSHLLHLVNNLLDKSRIDAGKIIVEKTVFNPRAVISDCVRLIKVSADKKQIGLSADLSIPSQLTLNGDAGLLRQILINLMGNAVKFTDKGGVKVIARIEEKENEHLLCVEIDDTGIGIAPGRISSIFNEFEQGDSSINRKYGGTGLGLWITKKLIEAQAGNISVNSHYGKGTHVEIKMPYASSEIRAVNNTGADKLSAMRDISGIRVLVVDDEAYNRKLVSLILKKYGVEIIEAESGPAAIGILSDKKTSLALIDIHMPGMDGFQLIGNIRGNLHLNEADFPVIAVTADLTEEKSQAYKAAGINASISKPFNEAELVQLISKYANHEKS